MGNNKTQYNISLTAVLACGTPCNTTNCQHVADFINKDKCITVTEFEDCSAVELRTEHGTYTVPKHPSLNAYIGTCSDVKVRITLKKMVGTLTYWS